MGSSLSKEQARTPSSLSLIGGSDQHIGITAIEEDNYFGVTPMAHAPGTLGRLFEADRKPVRALGP